MPRHGVRRTAQSTAVASTALLLATSCSDAEFRYDGVRLDAGSVDAALEQGERVLRNVATGEGAALHDEARCYLSLRHGFRAEPERLPALRTRAVQGRHR